MFPSPIGVIFFLIDEDKERERIEKLQFPSPIGVIFSLIGSKGRFYSEIKEILFPSPIGVIFSLILDLNTD